MALHTYRAVQVVVAPHTFEMVERHVADPGPGHVRIRVEACGVCHSDSASVETDRAAPAPHVPGHEIVGLIDAVGDGVSDWQMGRRVGVGFLGGHCGVCTYCRRGDFVKLHRSAKAGNDRRRRLRRGR